MTDNTVTGTQSLQAAFGALRDALGSGDLESFYAMMDAEAVIYDEDIPFRLNRASFQEHIDFHVSGTWDSFEWYPRDVWFRCFGETGIVAGYVTFRGKPADAGFRQKHMSFSQGWILADSAWRLVEWHQSPFDGQIIEASPS